MMPEQAPASLIKLKQARNLGFIASVTYRYRDICQGFLASLLA